MITKLASLNVQTFLLSLNFQRNGSWRCNILQTWHFLLWCPMRLSSTLKNIRTPIATGLKTLRIGVYLDSYGGVTAYQPTTLWMLMVSAIVSLQKQKKQHWKKQKQRIVTLNSKTWSKKVTVLTLGFLRGYGLFLCLMVSTTLTTRKLITITPLQILLLVLTSSSSG